MSDATPPPDLPPPAPELQPSPEDLPPNRTPPDEGQLGAWARIKQS